MLKAGPSFLVILVVAGLGCAHRDYAYLNADQENRLRQRANQEKIDQQEWLSVNDMLEFRSRFVKKYLDKDQIARAAALLRSKNDSVRSLAIGLFADPRNDEERKIACRYLEPMTSDPNPDLRTLAILQLYHDQDPKIQSLAKANLASVHAGELEKQVCEKIERGESPIAQG